jgi:hypothetical protein
MAFLVFRHVLLFGVTERPYFVALNEFAGKITQSFVLVFGTCLADIGQEFDYRVLRNTCHPDSGTD